MSVLHNIASIHLFVNHVLWLVGLYLGHHDQGRPRHDDPTHPNLRGSNTIPTQTTASLFHLGLIPRVARPLCRTPSQLAQLYAEGIA